LVGGWVDGAIVDGAVGKIVKHVIWKLIKQQATFPSNSRTKETKISYIVPLVGDWVGWRG